MYPCLAHYNFDPMIGEPKWILPFCCLLKILEVCQFLSHDESICVLLYVHTFAKNYFLTLFPVKTSKCLFSEIRQMCPVIHQEPKPQNCILLMEKILYPGF